MSPLRGGGRKCPVPGVRWRLVTAAAAFGLLAASCSDAPQAYPPTTAVPPTAPNGAASTAPASTITATSSPTTAVTLAGPDRTRYEACLTRAVFEDPGDSPYRLPFPVGAGYTIVQSYCHLEGSHEWQLSYDFWMAVGSEVAAARAGVVRELREDFPDGPNTSGVNYVYVVHADGTVASYAHLTKDGVLVELGQEVEAGEVIAISGASGRTDPHGVLHFQVFRSWPPRDGDDVPVVFSNAEGRLDARGGLREGTFYRALP